MIRTQILQIQPLVLTIHSGTLMMVTNREGWINGGRLGLFAHDTRYLSTYEITIEEFTPKFLTAQRPLYNCAIFTYTNPSFRAGPVFVDELGLFLKVSRSVDEDLYEEIEIKSFIQHPIQFRMLINFESSFDDIFEVRALQPTPPRVSWSRYDESSRTVTSYYRDGSFHRRLEYRIISADSCPSYSPNLLIFPVHLHYQQTWQAGVQARLAGEPLERYAVSTIKSPTDEVRPWTAPDQPAFSFPDRLRAAHADVDRWMSHLPRIEVPSAMIQRACEQSLRDLASLRLQKVGDEWYPSAGVPWYNCMFGRDALITAWQCLPLGCPFPRAVLTRLAELQGTRVNRWNDEEPGKILHELRVGQLSLTGKIPFYPFYGTVDASLLYVILLAETYRFTGDRQILQDFIGAAEACLRWAAEYGDIDGDGFVEYWMRSPRDYHNQAWKDSSDAVVYPDGRIVPDPIAIVEVQGLYYAALCDAAEIYRVLGKRARADECERRAADLFERFNEQYWLPDEEFYAYGLDPDKQPIRSIASNPGQLLWTRIVPPDRAARVVKRLMAEDSFCGWGIRTLSCHNGAYAPLMYQRGSIWPHDNAIIALGMKRCGHWEPVNHIAEGIFAASSYFADGCLPELWAGLDRVETLWPVLYPEANVPQAWAAGSVPMLLRAILGIEPDVERRRLIVQPTLPDWLDELTIRQLPFADGSVDLRFSGRGAETRVDILRTSGSIGVEHRTVPVEAL
jgi:glycogen debranching enzyme